MSIWNLIKTGQERYNLLQWVVMTFIFISGALFNAATKVTDWIYLPYDNKRNITILLEKSEELSSFVESLKSVQRGLSEDNTKTSDRVDDIDKSVEGINKNVDNLEIELRANLRRLEDGQLRLFLKTERLDERTQKQGGNTSCGDQC